MTCERLRATALEIAGGESGDELTLGLLAERADLSEVVVAEHYPRPLACLYETYDEVSASVVLDMASAFAEGSTWESGFELSRRRLLEHLAANPAEARLCFVETMRADRELRRRRDATRQWIVQLLASDYRRRGVSDGLTAIQIEMLIGAGFHAISAAIAAGEPADLVDLEPKLAALADVFMPTPA